MIRQFVPLGEFTPDRTAFRSPSFGAQDSSNVPPNVIPLTTDSYGPCKKAVVFAEALPAECRGSFAGRSSVGNVTIFAGTATNLYKLESDATWTSVGSGYSVGASEHWEFAQFGETVIAVNIADAPQAWTLDVSVAFAPLAGSPPKARHIAVVEPGFVMLGNLDASGTLYPGGVQWCAYNDPTDWPTPGTSDAASKQSDRSVLALGGWVNRIIGPVGGASGAIISDTTIHRIEFSGPPTIFRFIPVVQGRGSKAPFSVIPVAISNSQTVAFLRADDGYYAFDGTTAQPIGTDRVDRTFIGLDNTSLIHRVCGAADPERKLVWWLFNNRHLAVYNWSINRWSYAILTDLHSTSGVFMTTLLSIGYTLDALDTLGYTMETLPFSLDDRVWTGGAPSLAVFDDQHRLCYFTGVNASTEVKTGEIDGGNGRRIFVAGVRPVIDAEPSEIVGSIRYRNYGANTSETTSQTANSATGLINHRISARYARAIINIAAGSAWTQWSGNEFHFRPEGLR